eukprot:gene1538-2966_t
MKLIIRTLIFCLWAVLIFSFRPTRWSLKTNYDSIASPLPTHCQIKVSNILCMSSTDESNSANINDPRITPIEMNDELKSSFMSYAMSTILGRALPDARDGLKPVHRRVLFAMNALNLNPDSSYRKCARIVGEVLGKFHPHGDQSVYDALVRMAQDFVLSHPLVDGHGNFGSVDNDPAAAMRYTEAKLSHLAYDSLLADIKERTVDFVANFDGNEEEPVVLPARFPILLLSGSSGIAVGMATNIPPHNLGELADGVVALIDDPSLEDSKLFEIIPAPDFPTGGQIMGVSGAKEMYETGRGSVLMRAKCHIEAITSGGGGSNKTGGTRTRSAIVVTELPYLTNKAALLEKIAAMVNDKKLEGISDLRDESDRDGIRMVVELKRDAVPAVVLNNLFKKTALQTTFSGNLIALVDEGKQPQRIALKQALHIFITFRFETLRRRAAFQLEKVSSRLHIVEGLIRAISRLDAVIDVVRSAKDQSDARQKLCSDGFGLTVLQADAVLGLRLGRLTALEDTKLREEESTLRMSQAALQSLMTNDAEVFSLMRKETLELKQRHATPRRSEIVFDKGDLSEEDLVPNDRSVILLTKSGYIKRVPIMEFEAQSRGGRGKAGISMATGSKGVSGGGGSGNIASLTETSDPSEMEVIASGGRNADSVTHFFSCNDHDTVIFITDRGVAYNVKAYQVPLSSRTARGVPLPQVLPIGLDERVTSLIPVDNFAPTPPLPPTTAASTASTKAILNIPTLKIVVDEVVDDVGESLVLLTAHGYLKKTPLRAFENISARGLIIVSLSEGDSLKWARRCQPGDEVIIATRDGFASRFAADDLVSTGRKSRGSRALRLREGDEMADMDIVRANQLATDGLASEPLYLLAVTQRGYGKRMSVDEFRRQKRGCKGCIAIKFKPKAGGGGRASRAEGKSRTQADALSCMRVCRAGDDVVLSTSRGTVLRQRVGDVSVQSRSATGVLLQRLDKDDTIMMVDIVPPPLPDGDDVHSSSYLPPAIESETDAMVTIGKVKKPSPNIVSQ